MNTRPIAAAAVLALSSVAGANEPTAAGQMESQAPVPAEEVIQIAFDQDRYERMTVPVTIGGKGPYRFFVDTGAQATVVTNRITSDLQIEPRGKATLVAMGSRREVDMIDIDNLEFADRSLSGLRAPLLERQHIGADGILGLDSLQDMRVLIDFNEDSMSVADAETLGGTYGYEIVVRARARLGQMIITDARINGVKTAVIIDTGAQTSVGNAALLGRLRARARDSFIFVDVNGVPVESGLAYARSLKIGRLEMKQVPIGFHASPAFEALGLTDKPALILGMRNLRLFNRVAIDFASRRVMFDVPRDVREGQRRWLSGENRS